MTPQAMVQDVYYRLRKSERRIADYVLQQPEKMVYQNISEIAEISGVSEATVIRFCKSCGFDGFQDMKISFARNSQNSEKLSLYDNISKDDSISEGIGKSCENNRKALESTQRNLNPDMIAKAAEVLCQAKIIYLYGLGTSGIIADYIAYRLMRIGKIAVRLTDSHSIAISAPCVKKEDAVLAISQSGSTPEIAEALKALEGVDKISIVGYPKSNVAKNSDIVLINTILLAPTDSGNMTSFLSQLSVADALLVCMALKNFVESEQMAQITAEAVKNKKY